MTNSLASGAGTLLSDSALTNNGAYSILRPSHVPMKRWSRALSDFPAGRLLLEDPERPEMGVLVKKLFDDRH
ncbi:MAG: hypothetical protein ABJD68_15570, partial [Nakamurella sp.]